MIYDRHGQVLMSYFTEYTQQSHHMTWRENKLSVMKK